MFDPSDVKITKSNRKSIAIVIHPDGLVEVRAPHLIPKFMINNFIKSKREWIEEKLAKVSKRKKTTKQFAEGERFLYLGNEYALMIGQYLRIEAIDGKLLLPLAMAQRGKEHLEKWYEKQAKIVIKEQVDFYSKKYGYEYNGLSFSDTRSKWGSCTHDNRLQFSWRLVMAPLLVVRYVVLHELVHTVEKNHSAKFWSRVRMVNPSYKQQIKWLKEFGVTLHF